MTAFTERHPQSLVDTGSETLRFALGIALSAVSGVLLLLAFPPYGLWILIWVACVPYRYAQHRLLPLKWSSLAEATAMLVWLGPFMARMFGTDNGPFFTYLGVLIAILVFFLARERRFHEQTGYRWFVVQGVLGWVGFEMIRATFIPLVATSAFIGYTQSTIPWITQPVSLFSVYGLNLLIMLVNFSLAQALIAWSDRQWTFADTVPISRSQARRGLATMVVMVLFWFGISTILLERLPDDPPQVRVAAVQPGYDLPAFQDEVNDDHLRLTAFKADAALAAQQGATVVFTPEMMFNFDPQREHTAELRELAADLQLYLMLNYTVAQEGETWRNEAVLLAPTGEFSAVYGKNEIPPGEPLTPTAGVYPVFNTPLGRLAALICHDANYTATTRRLAAGGAQLISAGLNEFGGFGEQYWTNVSFRAIENRVAMVVTARENGSAIINPDGSVAALTLNPEEHVVLVGDVALGDVGALYTRLGDWLGWLSLIGFAGFVVYQMVLDRRAKTQLSA